jgi:hypothetical protein
MMRDASVYYARTVTRSNEAVEGSQRRPLSHLVHPFETGRQQADSRVWVIAKNCERTASLRLAPISPVYGRKTDLSVLRPIVTLNSLPSYDTRV